MAWKLRSPSRIRLATDTVSLSFWDVLVMHTFLDGSGLEEAWLAAHSSRIVKRYKDASSEQRYIHCINSRISLKPAYPQLCLGTRSIMDGVEYHALISDPADAAMAASVGQKRMRTILLLQLKVLKGRYKW